MRKTRGPVTLIVIRETRDEDTVPIYCLPRLSPANARAKPLSSKPLFVYLHTCVQT